MESNKTRQNTARYPKPKERGEGEEGEMMQTALGCMGVYLLGIMVWALPTYLVLSGA